MFGFARKPVSPPARPAALKIKLSTSFPQWPLAQQTPGGRGAWKEAQFFIDQPVESCDAWFVCDGLTKEETTVCPPENVVLITAEPPSIRVPKPAWLRQFAQVITSQRGLRHAHVTLAQTGLPWHAGKSYDELQGPFPAKSKDLSVIVSNKSFTAGHKKRLNFVERLRERNCGEIFGRGVRELASKWDGLAAYRYSVAVENCAHPDYWTEKIADCFLAGAVPFYYGCPNIADFFPEEALVRIDLDAEEAAAARIAETLGRDDWAGRQAALAKAKSLVLDEYNLFNVITGFCARLEFGPRRRKIRLQPEPP